ncbi:MAG: LuxR C-terminal-related transcriptional regulator [Acidobacteria bacterium]|nr:LuxR C-terminal-related transcriptional regulator [Acidobacteriota bacterium]
MTDAASIAVTGLYRALVDALPDMIAVISKDAKIVFVNDAWERFGRENGSPNLVGARVGDDYLRADRDDAVDNPSPAQRARRGIADVLNGARDHFALEYPCDSPNHKRWFRLQVFPIPGTADFNAVVHHEITEYERLRGALRKQQPLDEISSDGSRVPTVDLAPRQRQVLELVAKGFSNREIAFTMGITTKTVDYHLRTLKTKLGKHRRAELVRASLARDVS